MERAARVCHIFASQQISTEIQSVLPEAEDVISCPNPELILTEMIHQVIVWVVLLVFMQFRATIVIFLSGVSGQPIVFSLDFSIRVSC